MIFQMQEGYLTLATGAWQDRTVNMLSANHLPVKGTNLVVTREALPDGLCLADYIANQKSVLAKELPKYKLLADNTDTINEQPAHFIALTWDNQGIAMHQMLLAIDFNRNIINITATVPGEPDEACRAELLSAMRSFTPGPAPVTQEGAAT